jgi:hypothetical protein
MNAYYSGRFSPLRGFWQDDEKGSIPPALPRHARTRSFPSFVLASPTSSMYPEGIRSVLASPAASLDDLFDLPARFRSASSTRITRTRPTDYLAGVHTRDVPYSARRGSRRRAQRWRVLFIAPCAVRETPGNGRVPRAKRLFWQARGGWARQCLGRAREKASVSAATAFMNNPG